MADYKVKDQGKAVRSTVTTFGQQLVQELTPITQDVFTYGLINSKVYQFTYLGGTLSVSDSKLQASCGGSVGSTAFIRSNKYTAYRAGQGTVLRFTAIFDVSNATTGVSQVAGGFGGSESGLFFGYDWTTNEFGVDHQYGGVRELQKLTVTTGAGGAETATVTLNGAATAVALTAGNTTNTAQQLSEASFSFWEAFALGPDVYFLSSNVGDKTGTFSVASTGTTAGTFTEVTAGVAATNDWVPQASWNRNTLTEGSFVLDPSKGNIYEIRAAYFGGIDYYVQDPISGQMVHVHRVEYSNRNTNVNLTNPNLAPGCAVSCLTSTQSVTMQLGSFAAYIEGQQLNKDLPLRGFSTSGTSSGSAPAMSIRNNVVFNDKAQFRDVLPRRILVAATTGNKPMKIDVVRNGTLTGPAWAEVENGQSPVHTDTSATAITGGTTILSSAVAPSSNIELRLSDVELHRGDVLTLVLEPTGTNMDYVVSVDWVEDV